MRPLRIESIQLENIGPFRDYKLEFKPVDRDDIAEVHILSGPNGSGKSTLLSACFETVFDINDGWLIRRMHRDKGIVKVELCGESFISSNVPSSDSGSRIRAKLARDARHLAQGLQGLSGMLPINNQFFYYSAGRTVSVSSVGPNGLPSNTIASNDKEIDTRLLLDWIIQSFTKAALAETEGAVTEAQVYRHNVKRVAALLSEISDSPLGFSIDRHSLTVRLGVGDHATAVDLLPDGLKSMLAWLGDLIRRLELPWDHVVNIFSRPFILLLDEIDIHLHPAWQRRVLPALQKAFPAAQIIVSTHSPFVIGSIANAWVYRLDPLKTECEPVPSGAGESISTILEDIFGISEIFDPETHRLFEEFYKERQRVLAGEDTKSLENLARELSARGEEVQDIVSRELAQLKRLTGKKVGHAQV